MVYGVQISTCILKKFRFTIVFGNVCRLLQPVLSKYKCPLICYNMVSGIRELPKPVQYSGARTGHWHKYTKYEDSGNGDCVHLL